MTETGTGGTDIDRIPRLEDPAGWELGTSGQERIISTEEWSYVCFPHTPVAHSQPWAREKSYGCCQGWALGLSGSLCWITSLAVGEYGGQVRSGPPHPLRRSWVQGRLASKPDRCTWSTLAVRVEDRSTCCERQRRGACLLEAGGGIGALRKPRYGCRLMSSEACEGGRHCRISGLRGGKSSQKSHLGGWDSLLEDAMSRELAQSAGPRWRGVEGEK